MGTSCKSSWNQAGLTTVRHLTHSAANHIFIIAVAICFRGRQAIQIIHIIYMLARNLTTMIQKLHTFFGRSAYFTLQNKCNWQNKHDCFCWKCFVFGVSFPLFVLEGLKNHRLRLVSLVNDIAETCSVNSGELRNMIVTVVYDQLSVDSFKLDKYTIYQGL